jgi:hypothetical protein
MAGIILNGTVIKGLMLNGSPVSAILNGVKVFPTEEPSPYGDKLLSLPTDTYVSTTSTLTQILSGRTWNTNKNFIVYKGTLLCSGTDKANDYYTSSIRLQNPNASMMDIDIGKYVENHSGNDGTWSANEVMVQVIDLSAWRYSGTSTAGTDGKLTRSTTYCKGYTLNPTIYMTDVPVNFRFIFDKSSRIVYFYINGKYVCNFGISSYGDASTWSILAGNTATIGMDVYACNTLDDAIAV